MEGEVSAKEGPLAGIKVIDCSRVLAGPYCGVLLSHLGADVIKVEDIRGDEMRQWPPSKGDIGASFMALNANKRSVAVDLKSAPGAQVVKDLAARADVLIENFKTGDMERFGLGYEQLQPLNPRLVYTSISAFGRSGPKATDPGYEALVQAYSGVMAITGEPGGAPVRCGVSFLDMGTGVMSAFATVTALFERNATGRGTKVEASLLGTSMGLMSNLMASFMQHGIQPQRMGTAHPQVVPYQVYGTEDGFIFIASGNQNLYERMCRALGRQDLIDDPRFENNAARVEHREACIGAVSGSIGTWKTEALMAELDQHGVPYTRVNEYQTLFDDGQVESTGAIAEGEDPDYGAFKVPGLPFKMLGHDTSKTQTGPRLGEHTVSVLRDELGYEESAIDRLIDDGAIAARPAGEG